jgi:hypothetical protein
MFVSEQLDIKLYELDLILRMAAARGMTVTIDLVDRDDVDPSLGPVRYTSVIASGIRT